MEMQNNTTNLSQKLLVTKQVADLLGISASTLEKARSTGIGNYPPYIKVGRCVRYRLADVLAWLEKNRHEVGAPIL